MMHYYNNLMDLKDPTVGRRVGQPPSKDYYDILLNGWCSQQLQRYYQPTISQLHALCRLLIIMVHYYSYLMNQSDSFCYPDLQPAKCILYTNLTSEDISIPGVETMSAIKVK